MVSISIPKPEIPGQNRKQKLAYVVVYTLLVLTLLFLIITLTTPVWAVSPVKTTTKWEAGRPVPNGNSQVTVGIWRYCDCTTYYPNEYPDWTRTVQAFTLMAAITAALAITAFVVRVFVTDTKLFITTVTTGVTCLVTGLFLLIAVSVYAGQYQLNPPNHQSERATGLGPGFALACTSLIFSVVAGVVSLLTIRWEM